MALVAFDLDEGDVGGGGVQRLHDVVAFGRRVEPVGGERDHAEAGAGPAKRGGQHAVMIGRDIEIVHRPRQIEIGVGVEALDE